MLFDSVVFLFAFLPVLLIAYHLMPGQLKNGALFLASLLFYAWSGLAYVIFMVCSVLFNYACGLWIAGQSKRRAAKIRMIVCVIVNIGLLLVLKYGGYVLAIVDTGEKAGWEIEFLAPVGITFYTLRILSYIIDVYRKDVKVQKNPVDLALYAMMFPVVLAGPVVRYSAFAKQLRERRSSWIKFGDGSMFFIRGLAKKALLADNIGRIYTEVMALEAGQMSVLTAWLGCAAYAFQIYFAFSGYADMAIGLGRMIGFELPKNFDYPYAARSVTEYWRRWNITLRMWVEEYVRPPLGVDRVPVIFFVWLIVGLWHGLSWNFVVWSLYFSILMVIERNVLQGLLSYMPGFFRRIYCIVLVLAGWVFFFSPGVGEAGTYLRAMFGINANGLIDSYGRYILMSNLGVLIVSMIGLTPGVYRLCEKIFDRGGQIKAVISGILYGLLFVVSVAYMVAGVHQSFLYLRF